MEYASRKTFFPDFQKLFPDFRRLNLLVFEKKSSVFEKEFFFFMSVPKEVWEFAYLVMSNELKSKFKSSNPIFDKTEEDLPEDPVFFCDKILYLRCLHENILLQQLQNIAHFTMGPV